MRGKARTENPTQTVSVLTKVRRAVAVAIVVVAAGIGTYAVLVPDDIGCSTSTMIQRPTLSTPSAGRSEVTTTTCKGVPVADLVPLALLAGVLFLPDLSELGVAGLITLKRRVEQQESVTASQAARQDALERILVLQSSATATSQANLDVRFFLRDGLLLHDIESKERQVFDTTDSSTFESHAYDPGNNAREEDLIHLAGILAEYEGPNSERELPPESQEAVRRWRRLFSTELATVRAVRNKVAHPPHDLSSDELGEAVTIARRLVDVLNRAIQHPPMVS